MTELLKKVLEVAGAVLPDKEQNALAESILEDIRSEMAWDETLAETYGQLRALADEALAEHDAGRTTPIEPKKKA